MVHKAHGYSRLLVYHSRSKLHGYWTRIRIKKLDDGRTEIGIRTTHRTVISLSKRDREFERERMNEILRQLQSLSSDNSTE